MFASGYSSSQITTFSLNRTDGSLSEVSQYSYPIERPEGLTDDDYPWGGPMGMKVNAAGTRLYVADKGGRQNWDNWGDGYCSVSVFDINHASGELTPIAGSPFFLYSDPDDIDDDGVADSGDSSIGAAVYNSYCNVTALAFNDDESILFATGGDDSVGAFFRVDGSTGALTHYATLNGTSGHYAFKHPAADLFLGSYYFYTLDPSDNNSVTEGSNWDGSWSYLYDGAYAELEGVKYLFGVEGNDSINVHNITDPNSMTTNTVSVYPLTVDGSGGDDDDFYALKNVELNQDASVIYVSDQDRNVVVGFTVDASDLSSFTPADAPVSVRGARMLQLSSDGEHLLASGLEFSILHSFSGASSGALEEVDVAEVSGASRGGLTLTPNVCD